MDEEPDPRLPGPRSSGPSLRQRVVLVLLLINLVVFTAGGLWLRSSLVAAEERRTADLLEELDASLRNTVNKGGDLNVRRILQDERWNKVADAMIVDKNLERVAGRVVHRGVALNPRGLAREPADRNLLLEALAQVIDSGAAVEVAGGLALRIEDRRGVWGAFWYRLSPELLANQGPLVQLLPWFLVSTALLTLGSYLVLAQLVLAPVGGLAAGVASLEAGDLSARVAVGSGAGELASLVRGFNAMAAEVEGAEGRLAEEVRRATRQARDAEKAALTQRQLAAMGEFTAGIAHEINNPPGGLLNATEVLGRDELEPERRRRYLGLLADGLERIQATVGQLLRFTPRDTLATHVDLVDVARDGLALVGHRARELGVELSLEVDGEAMDLAARPDQGQLRCPAWGARNELGQALLNLLGNALDALEPTGGHLAVALSSSPTGPRVVVADDGPGIDPGRLDRIADLFYTTKEVGKGSGLGLAIVSRILDAHGGRVTFESAPGAGFRATLELPAGPTGVRGTEASEDA